MNFIQKVATLINHTR